MTLTAFGPQGPNYATVRPPVDPNVSSGLDTWCQNCSVPGGTDGTYPTADFFNVFIANLRTAVSGVLGNAGLTGADNMLLNALSRFVPLIPATIFYVDGVLGNDSNDGLTATVVGTGHGPFATLAGAKAYISQFLSPTPVTIHIAAGTVTWSSGSTIFTVGTTLIAGWNLVGAGSTTILDGSASNIFGIVTNGDTVTVSNLKIMASNTCFVAQGAGQMFVTGGITASTSSTGAIFGCSRGGTLTIYGAHTLTGLCNAIFNGYTSGTINVGESGYPNAVFTVSALTINLATAVLTLGCCLVATPANVVFTGTPGGAGQRFQVATTGGIYTYASGYLFFPMGGYPAGSGPATYTITSPGYYS